MFGGSLQVVEASLQYPETQVIVTSATLDIDGNIATLSGSLEALGDDSEGYKITASAQNFVIASGFSMDTFTLEYNTATASGYVTGDITAHDVSVSPRLDKSESGEWSGSGELKSA